MKSEFAMWLGQMQSVANGFNIIVAAEHIDVLDYYFRMNKNPDEAFQEYKNVFLPRWNTLTKQ